MLPHIHIAGSCLEFYLVRYSCWCASRTVWFAGAERMPWWVNGVLCFRGVREASDGSCR